MLRRAIFLALLARLTDGWEVDPSATEHKSIVLTNLGGRGAYDNVEDIRAGVWPTCSEPQNGCVKQRKCVSGPLAPFDEEQSLVFRGPMELYDLAVFEYQGQAGGSFARTSFWNRSGSENVAFMNNKGGQDGDAGRCSGSWSVCQGNSQSYAAADGVGCAPGATQFRGSLVDGATVNTMKTVACSSKTDCDGAYRDTALHGWKGGARGEKVFVFQMQMPHSGGQNRPAAWLLNAKVLRTAQWGCNCRGVGGNGGCGEVDLIEAVQGNQYSDQLITQAYDFKGAGGSGFNRYFLRPVDKKATYAAILRIDSRGSGYAQVIKISNKFDFDKRSLTAATLDKWRGRASSMAAIYNVNAQSC